MTINKIQNAQDLSKIAHITDSLLMDSYAKRLSAGTIDIYICEEGESIIGKVCIDYDTNDLRTIKNDRVFLSDLFIVEAHRGKKQAQKFLSRVISELKEEGYIEFSIYDNTDGNTPISRIRKKLGFTDDWDTFYVKSN